MPFIYNFWIWKNRFCGSIKLLLHRMSIQFGGFFAVMIKYIATTFLKGWWLKCFLAVITSLFNYGISLQYRLYIDPPVSGLVRCGKSCRLRWLNYLRPNIKRGNYSKEEEETIIRLHESQGNRYLSIGCSFQPGWNLNVLFICCGSYD